MRKRFLAALLAALVLSAAASVFVSEYAVARLAERFILERASDRLSMIAWGFGAVSSDVDIYSYLDFNKEVLVVRKGKIPIFQYGTSQLSEDSPGVRVLYRVSGSYEFSLTVDYSSSMNRYMDLSREPIAITTLIFSALFCLFGYLLLRSAIDPISGMAASMHRITARNLQVRLDLPARKDEIGQLAATFNGLLDEIQSAAERQAQFVDDLAHDLATPIQILEGYRQLIERHGKSDKLVDEYLAVSKAQLGRLKAMSGALKANLAQEKRLNSERADATELVLRLGAYYRELFPHLRFQVEAAPGILVPARPEDLERMAHILLDNAVKYGAGGGLVAVALTPSELVVADRGGGIAPDEREAVFERRYRGRAASGEGSGLGLSILRKFAEEYGFSVSVEESPGGGALFRLRFSPS